LKDICIFIYQNDICIFLVGMQHTISYNFQIYKHIKYDQIIALLLLSF